MIREKQWIMLDNFKRKIFLKYELKKTILNSIILNSKIPLSYRYIAYYQKIKLPRKSNKSLHGNRCTLTGRIWTVTKQTRLSRFTFRTQSYSGNLPGFRRASW